MHIYSLYIHTRIYTYVYICACIYTNMCIHRCPSNECVMSQKRMSICSTTRNEWVYACAWQTQTDTDRHIHTLKSLKLTKQKHGVEPAYMHICVDMCVIVRVRRFACIRTRAEHEHKRHLRVDMRTSKPTISLDTGQILVTNSPFVCSIRCFRSKPCKV